MSQSIFLSSNFADHGGIFRDPAVAKLVRILHVFPGYIKETMDNRMEQPSFRSMKSRLLTLGNILLEDYLFLKCFPRHRFMRMLRRSEDVVQLMLDVLSGLPNVTDYFVTWCGPPSTSTTVFSFLPTVVQSNLRKFSLEISLENVMNLITPSFHLPHLEELHLSIHSENIPSAEERRAIMTDRLAPAINCLKTLQTLTIHSWEPADLSPLFYAICRLPSLQSLTVAIPVEDVHLGNPEAFAYFLHSHASTLHTLRLRASQYGGAGLTPDEISFDTWVREAICTVELPNLGTLDISSHLFPSLTAEACVRRFGCSVRSLSLTGCYRSYELVEDLLNIVLAYQPQQPLPMELEVNEERQQQEETTDELPLERLRLGIVSLSPQLMRLIEIKLPRLQKLDLIVRYMLPHALDFPEMQKVSEGQSCEQVVRPSCLLLLSVLLLTTHVFNHGIGRFP